MQEIKEHIATKLVPQLRFKEFEGVWKKTTLGDLFTFKNGLNSDKEKYGSGTKFINVLDIIGEDVITYDSIIGKVEVTEKELEKNEVIYGDVLFQRSSETREEVGQANIYVDENNSAVFGGFVIRGRKKEDYNPYFMNYLLKTSPARKEITTKSGGSTRYNVGQASLSEVFVILTSLPEQQKIASFLSTVDEKIQQLTNKKALLKHYKKGVMQQLFSGELRFKDENGNPYSDWEEKRLGEVTSYVDYRGRGPEKSDKGIFLVTAKNIKKGFIDYNRSQEFIPAENRSIVMSKGLPMVGDILFTTEAPLGNVAQVDNDDIALAQRVIKFRGKDELQNNYLLNYMLSSKYQKLIIRQAIGTTVQGISGKDLRKTLIEIPCKEEQQKIATYLTRIDTKIESVNNQITQTQTFKKGLLQQMFV